MSNKPILKIEEFTWKELLINSSAAFYNRILNMEKEDPKKELYETISKLIHYAYTIENYE